MNCTNKIQKKTDKRDMKKLLIKRILISLIISLLFCLWCIPVIFLYKTMDNTDWIRNNTSNIEGLYNLDKLHYINKELKNISKELENISKELKEINQELTSRYHYGDRTIKGYINDIKDNTSRSKRISLTTTVY